MLRAPSSDGGASDDWSAPTNPQTLETVRLLRDEGLSAFTSCRSIRTARHASIPNLVHFRYDMIASPMGERACQECRALILDEADDWAVVSYPFFKFWNHGEPHAADIDWSTARVQEKLDGSLTCLYPYRGEWHVSTTGTADGSGPGGTHRGTFADLFWETWRALGYRLPPQPGAGRRACFMFELMSPHTRVIVPHAESRLACIRARNLDTLDEFPAEDAAVVYGWACARSFPLACLADVVSACEALNPLEGEGYVVRDARFHRVKVKSPRYVALSVLKQGVTARRLLEIVRANESSELLAYFPEFRRPYERVRAHYDALCDELEAVYAGLRAIPEQKAFALEATRHRGSPPLFAIRSGSRRTVREFFATCTLPVLERAMPAGWADVWS